MSACQAQQRGCVHASFHHHVVVHAELVPHVDGVDRGRDQHRRPRVSQPVIAATSLDQPLTHAKSLFTSRDTPRPCMKGLSEQMHCVQCHALHACTACAWLPEMQNLGSQGWS